MSYKSRDHLFLFHANALALGGWVKDKSGHLAVIDSKPPSVLSIAGGHGSTSAHDVNVGVRGKYPFGEDGPGSFQIYVGHAYTEVRGVEDEDEDPYGLYRTTVRSVLDNVRINDVFEVEHAEAILMSTHGKPGRDGSVDEGKVVVGDSNMSGVRVAGKRVGLEKRDSRNCIDHEPSFGALQQAVKDRLSRLAGTSGTPGNFPDDLCDWNDPMAIPGAPQYALDFAAINQKAKSHLRFSLFNDVDLPPTSGARAFKSSIEVDDFGRIVLGEVMASHGTKQVTMFRIDLGCDNCGGVGGSDGTTNGSTIPP
jgi:hypothetical protein